MNTTNCTYHNIVAFIDNTVTFIDNIVQQKIHTHTHTRERIFRRFFYVEYDFGSQITLAHHNFEKFAVKVPKMN